MGYPNLSSLAVCGRASPASRNEELSDARHSNRSDPQAGKLSPRTRRRRRLPPSARLHRLRLHSRPHRTLGAGAGTAERRVAPKPGGEFQRCSPRWRRQPRPLTTAVATSRELEDMPFRSRLELVTCLVARIDVLQASLRITLRITGIVRYLSGGEDLDHSREHDTVFVDFPVPTVLQNGGVKLVVTQPSQKSE